jgi:predicted nucleic acid-binding protein
MILVDTSVWIDHFRQGDDCLVDLLRSGQVLTHELVIGELACGSLPDRANTLANLLALPRLPNLPFEETLLAIDRLKLSSIGIGFVDVSLLSAALVSPCVLWSRDKRLLSVVETLGIAFQEFN